MTRRVVKVLPLLGCMLTLTSAAGCGDPCKDLANQICVCYPDDGTRATCNQRASDAESTFPVNQQDKAFCQQLLAERLVLLIDKKGRFRVARPLVARRPRAVVRVTDADLVRQVLARVPAAGG